MSTELDVISNWLKAYQKRDHDAMAACYHDEATFEDIAFDLEGRRTIHAMWHMICEKGIDVSVDAQPVEDGGAVVARITAKYVFSKTGRDVVNPIASRFLFRDGLIVEHKDQCDPVNWADQALGGVKGWLAGRLGFIRKRAARETLGAFLDQHAEYKAS